VKELASDIIPSALPNDIFHRKITRVPAGNAAVVFVL